MCEKDALHDGRILGRYLLDARRPWLMPGPFLFLFQMENEAMAQKLKTVQKAWIEHIKASNRIKKLIRGTSNIMGDYSEFLIRKLYKAEKMPNSNKSFDLKCEDGTRIQVKSRQVSIGKTDKSLNVFRSWDFDLLVVVLFWDDGSLYKVIEMKADDAKTFRTPNKHQNGFIIHTSKEFLECREANNRTAEMKKMIDEE